MDRNKISRRYIITKYFERTNTKTTLKEIVSATIKQNQRKYGHSKTISDGAIKLLVNGFGIRWRNYKKQAPFYKKASVWLDFEEKLIENNGKYAVLFFYN